jgi:hypothetical protein
MFYVYVHYKADTKEPFYVGKGTKDRATHTGGRSKFWTNIYKKHGFYHQIIKTFPTEEEAFQHEIDLIANLSKTHKLANLATGGYGGSSGFSPTEETRNKISNSLKGRVHSPEAREKLSKALTGKIVSVETRQKLARSQTGKKLSSETRLKLSEIKSAPNPKLQGTGNPKFKGYVYGLSKTNLVVLCGTTDIRSRGFNSGAIYQQIQGKVSQHKGFKFYRTKDLSTIPQHLPHLDKETTNHLTKGTPK